jgi:hypothetical protein
VKTLWQFIRIWWSWRAYSPAAFRNSLSPILIAIVHFIVFGAASILASHITTVGNQVLIASSPHCGPWYYETSGPQDPITLQSSVAYNAYVGASVEASIQYVQNCLSGAVSLPMCSQFTKQRLNWTSEEVFCPFEDLCLGPEKSSWSMATALLDSRNDFGINGRNEDRVSIRRNTTCSPITTAGFTKRGTTSLNYQSPNANASLGRPPLTILQPFMDLPSLLTVI